MINNFGKTLARIRKTHKLTQAQVVEYFAERGIDINPQTISRWEQGQTCPRADQFIVFCKLMEVDNIYAEFLGEASTTDSPLFLGLNELGLKMALDYVILLRESGRYSVTPSCAAESRVERIAT